MLVSEHSSFGLGLSGLEVQIPSVGGRSTRDTWPHDFVNQLGMILTRRLRELAYFFYHYCRIKFHPIAFPEFELDEGVGRSVHLSLTSFDPKVPCGTEGNQDNEGNSNETDSDSISRELNETIDIDALIKSGHKRRKTSTGVAHVNLSSKEEVNGP